jgi:uncharacterized cofD-like protein
LTPGQKPNVVALGGGHGLAATLRATRRYAGDITAIVSVADDGGSSGRLRESLGIPAPGDLRRCLVALGDPDSLWGRAFDHRFEAGELEGHALGNVIIAGLASATADFQTALAEAGRLVGAVGRVVPATATPVVLKASVDGEGEVEGQVRVQNSSRITRVSIVPPDAEPPPEAVKAILGAEQVVIGPGSLYTSVLAVIVVPQIREALESTTAQKVYVCNLRPEIPETEGYDTAAHVAALTAHGLTVDAVLDDHTLARPDGLAHDPAKLAGALRDLLG